MIPSVWGQEIHLLFSNGARKDGTVGPVSGTPNNVAIRLELAEELKDAPPFWGGYGLDVRNEPPIFDSYFFPKGLKPPTRIYLDHLYIQNGIVLSSK